MTHYMEREHSIKTYPSGDRITQLTRQTIKRRTLIEGETTYI